MQLFSKFTVSDARLTSVKTEFNLKWPFKFIKSHAFWDHWKPTRDSISLYDVGLNSKVSKDIASESTENSHFRHLTVVWCPLSMEPCEYLHKPWIARNKSLGYISAADTKPDSIGLSSLTFLWCALKNRFLNQSVYHPRSLISAPTESVYVTS